jgi:hypothetical protein
VYTRRTTLSAVRVRLAPPTLRSYAIVAIASLSVSATFATHSYDLLAQKPS